MNDRDFERSLAECIDAMERLSKESKRISKKINDTLTEHDGSSGETRWNCRTMTKDIDDVLSDITRRLERFRAGDRPELPTVLIMSIECCERLLDTAELCRAGRQDERRDLMGQISSNLGYLAQHLESMEEDDYLPKGEFDFTAFRAVSRKARDNTAELQELIDYICIGIEPIYGYLCKLRRERFWEPGSDASD